MNYIREELLRQREILAALMSGGDREQQEDDQQIADLMEDEREGLRGGERAELRRTRPGQKDRAGIRSTDEAWALETAGFERAWREHAWAAAEGETGPDGLRAMAEAWSASEKVRVPVEEERFMVVPQAVSGEQMASPPTAIMGRTLFAGEGTATPLNVRSVSRGIQRDARRYDGGFSMY